VSVREGSVVFIAEILLSWRNKQGKQRGRVKRSCSPNEEQEVLSGNIHARILKP
jgi:hypothetical protein